MFYLKKNRLSIPVLLVFLAVALLAACSPAATPTATQAPAAPPLETEPPATEPAATEAPETEPAATEPAATDQPEATGPAAQGDPIELTDDLDRTVVLPGPAQRVVSLAPSNTEILFAVGAGEQVVGRDDFSDYPAEAADLPSIGGSFGDYNFEAIVDLEPDLVFASELNTPEQVQALEDLGLTVYYMKNPTDLEGMYGNLETTGNLTGHEEETAALVGSLKERVAAVETALAEVEDQPLVFYEIDATDPSAPYTSGKGTFIDTLLGMAKAQNLGSVLEGSYAQISLEELLAQDPDFILLGDSVWGGVTAEAVAQRAGWEGLSALQEGRVLPFDDNLVSRPGPRLVDGLEELARTLHPEAFE